MDTTRGDDYAALANKLKPYILPWVTGGAGGASGGGGGAVGVHALNGPQHTGQLAPSQAAWAAMHKTVRAHLSLPEEFIVFCGISLGHADPAQPINTLVTERAALEEIAELRGFAEEARATEVVLTA